MAFAGELALPAWLDAMRDDDGSGEEFPWEKVLLARLEEARNRLDRERAEAPGLCAELLAGAPGDLAGPEAVAPRFRTWGVCEELLRQSAQEEDPGAASRLASLALAAVVAPVWAATQTVTLSVPGMTCSACPTSQSTSRRSSADSTFGTNSPHNPKRTTAITSASRCGVRSPLTRT